VLSLKNDVGTTAKQWGRHVLVQAPEEVNMEQDWTTIIIKRGLKSQERVLCLPESKEVRCLQKWSLRPIANI
jgi:hypothetical protein